jgi:glycosyltransferase involved in cell wall biosynthesis
MKISVCIPTFNSALYVRDCIESVLAQQETDFEVIVFDNASEDATWEIIKSFAHPRIRAFRAEQNRGMAANFNSALQEARGEYIKLLCSDDLLEPNALQLETNFLDQHPHAAMVTCATNLIGSDGKALGVTRHFSKLSTIDASTLRALTLIHGNVVGEPSAVLFRRTAWLNAGPFEEGLVTLIDLDMWFRLSRQGAIGYLPLPLCRIRRHPLSMTNRFRKAGEVQEAVLRMTESLLCELQASPFIRRVSLGKVAGSHVLHALYGIRRGFIKWPLSSIAKAFRNDPVFVGFFLYMTLFRSGLLGLRAEHGRKLSVSIVPFSGVAAAQSAALEQ